MVMDMNKLGGWLENDMIYLIKGNSGEGKLMKAFCLASGAGVIL